MRFQFGVEKLESRNLLSADLPTLSTSHMGDADFAPGDANRDGVFDQRDFSIVLQAGKYLSDQAASWQEGDWTGDGFFDTKDILLAQLHGCYGVEECKFNERASDDIVSQSRVTFLAKSSGHGKIVVANRESGTISIIDAGSGTLSDTIPLPEGDGDSRPDPMYVVNTPAANRVWVGDRANNRIVVFDGRDFSVETTLPAGNGVFHMWADQAGKQLWVVNDVDKSVTVINPQALEVITTITMPEDLMDGKPHDVILDPQGRFAYVTFLGIPGPDVVVQFDTATFAETNRQLVGEDPHLSFNRKNDQLYIPAQGSKAVFVLNANDLSIADEIAIEGAHGATTSTNSKLFCTTNLPGLGIDAVTCIDTKTNSVTDTADTNYPVPHNLALTPNGKKLFVTHSGVTSDKVSVFSIKQGALKLETSITVGLNPFGLAHVR